MRVFTNQEATVNALARADERAQATAWGDALTFGKLSDADDPDAFARARSLVYEEANWDEDRVVEADFRLRDAELAEAVAEGETVCLLFGNALNDQLQLAQIVSWLSRSEDGALARADMALANGSLSEFGDGELLEFAKHAKALDAATADVYRAVWQAVTADGPWVVESLFRRLRESQHDVLAAALQRWLQELPSVENGLSLSQGQLLDAVRLGVTSPRELFEAVEETETILFRNDWEFWQLIDRLCVGADPLLATGSGKPFLCPPKKLAWTDFHAQELFLTERGYAVLQGEQHLCDGDFPGRWLGGARIERGSRWFWNYSRRAIASERGAVARSI